MWDLIISCKSVNSWLLHNWYLSNGILEYSTQKTLLPLHVRWQWTTILVKSLRQNEYRTQMNRSDLSSRCKNRSLWNSTIQMLWSHKIAAKITVAVAHCERSIKCRSQSATVKIAATKWVQNPLCRSDFSAVTAIFQRKVADATKNSLTVNEA